MFKIKALMMCIFSLPFMVSAHEAHIVAFSFDRPLQLFAFLESLYFHSTHIHETSVIYRSSHPAFKEAYGKVKQCFPQVRFIEQKNPPSDFRSILLQELFRPESSDYVAFAVDDLMVTDKIDFDECITHLESTNAYGFYLRLGHNIDDGDSVGPIPLPPFTQVAEKIYSWTFNSGVGPFAYPNTVDMTIYRKKDIQAHFHTASFHHPNSLEDHFGMINLDLTGLCYDTSRVFNIPLNIVSETTATRHLNLTAKSLLDLFKAGFKMDISPLFSIQEPINSRIHIHTIFCEKERVC